jgi:hypothetical protein
MNPPIEHRELEVPPMRFLVYILCAGQIFTPMAQAEPGSSPASASLSGVQNILGTANDVMGAVQFSQAQMQQMMNQTAQLQQQQQQSQGPMNQFDQAKQQLAAHLAQAQQCVQGAQPNVAKYKKATIQPNQLAAVVPNCVNYGNVIDSIRKNRDEMYAINTRVQCLQTLQQQMNQLSEQSKGIFTQLTQTANQMWQTREKIIKSHEGIAKKISGELDGENGYRAKLSKLKEHSEELERAIGQGAEYDRSKGEIKNPGGLGAQVRQLQRSRTLMAQQWHQEIVKQTQTCFESDQNCPFGPANGSFECMNRNITMGNDTPGLKALAGNNEARLRRAMMDAYQDLGKTKNAISNLDVKNPEAVFKFSEGKLQSMIGAITQRIGSIPFQGNKVNRQDLAAYATQTYQRCTSQVMKTFREGLETDAGTTKQMLDGIKEQEEKVGLEIKIQMEKTQSLMTEFRTSFTKLYSADLSQFTASCKADEDPYQGLDCLRLMHARLRSGIEGRSETVRLSSGPTAVAPQMVRLNLQTLAVGQDGKPSLGTYQASCEGFNACIDVMEKYRDHHQGQQQKQTEERETFVEQHNQTMQAAMAGMATQFAAAGSMLTQAIQALGPEVSKLGLTAVPKTKAVEGETLTPDEKTKLLTMPKSMKAAFAGLSGFSELDDLQEFRTAFDSRAKELNETLSKAVRKKSECSLRNSDLAELSERLSCDAESVCDRGAIGNLIGPLERVFQRSTRDGQQDRDRSRIAEDYDRCSDRADNLPEPSIDDVVGRENESEARRRIRENQLQMRRERSERRNERASVRCMNSTVGALGKMADDSRASMRENNSNIVGGLRRLMNTCSRVPNNESLSLPRISSEDSPTDNGAEERSQRVAEAKERASKDCKSLKDRIKGMTVPDEGETPEDARSTPQSPLTPALQGPARSGR